LRNKALFACEMASIAKKGSEQDLLLIKPAHGLWGDALNPRCAYRFDSSARNRINPWSG
jgi:hypothetical protein